mmetsp:Transcript_85439/g.156527  ORF Transcript_85439/g.156527 Transcript_85439/m.156527 type:complete len:243 (-) Transcript_85439:1402-2130(-)
MHCGGGGTRGRASRGAARHDLQGRRAGEPPREGRGGGVSPGCPGFTGIAGASAGAWRDARSIRIKSRQGQGESHQGFGCLDVLHFGGAVHFRAAWSLLAVAGPVKKSPRRVALQEVSRPRLLVLFESPRGAALRAGCSCWLSRRAALRPAAGLAFPRTWNVEATGGWVSREACLYCRGRGAQRVGLPPVFQADSAGGSGEAAASARARSSSEALGRSASVLGEAQIELRFSLLASASGSCRL